MISYNVNISEFKKLKIDYTEYSSIFVQIFTGGMDDREIKGIISQINKKIPIENLVIIGSTTDDEIKNNKIISIYVFKNTTIIDQSSKDLEEIIKERTIELERINDTKSKFLATMSHEIRTPMNAILGSVELIADEIEARNYSGVVDFLSTIKTNGDHLVEIVSDVLDFSKIELGKLELNLVEVKIIQELENIISMFNFKAKEKQITFVTYIDPNLPSVISIDPVRLKQVFTNILGNAFKFTSNNGEISLTVDYVEKKDGLLISVSDSGIGIHEDGLKNIFKPFTQADSSTTQKFGGAGLGLNIVSSILEHMDGEIDVESKIGIGTDFFIRIPLKVIDREKYWDNYKEHIQQQKVIIFQQNTTDISCVKNYELLIKYLESYEIKSINQIDSLMSLLEIDVDVLFIIGNNINKEIIKKLSKIVKKITVINKTDIKLDNGNICNVTGPITPNIILLSLLNDEQNAIMGTDKCLLHETVNNSNRCILVDRPCVYNNSDIKYPPLNMQVLVIEDNKPNQAIIQSLLKKFDIESDVADNGQIGLDMFKKNIEKYDMIFIDQNMPIMDGIETCKNIRKFENKNNLPETYLVTLTANAVSGEKERMLAIGMNDFMVKPIKLPILREILIKAHNKNELIVSNLKNSIISPQTLKSCEKHQSVQEDKFVDNVYKSFEELFDGEMDNNMWNNFITGLSENYKDITSELKKENPDIKNICSLFHQIKTALSYCSLEEQYNIAQDFELQAKKGNLDFNNSKRISLFQTIERLI